MTPTCCRRPATRKIRLLFVLALLALAAIAALAPGLARPGDDAELVAEAMYLCDPLPPAGRDLNLSLSFAEGAPDPATGAAALVARPRVQLAAALSDRVGFTADVGLATDGGPALDAPAASLKVLLRDPAGGRTGIAASLDLLASTRALAGAEVGLGLGAIGAAGPVTLRASAALASPAARFGPHLHAGASAAFALGARWRVLGEVTGEVGSGERALAAGPALKVQLAEGTSLMAGALLALAPERRPIAFTVQLGQSL